MARFLALFTFLPMSEIREVAQLQDTDLNLAKAVLAFEATAIAHSQAEAEKAFAAAASMFGGRVIPKDLLPSSRITRGESAQGDTVVPQSEMTREALAEGIPAFKLFPQVGLADSGGAARRLISQGGAYVNGERVAAFDQVINDNDIKDMEIVLRAGKKRFNKIKIQS